jgi:hypothetical protein
VQGIGWRPARICRLFDGVAKQGCVDFPQSQALFTVMIFDQRDGHRCAGEQSPALGRESQSACGQDAGEVAVGDDDRLGAAVGMGAEEDVGSPANVGGRLFSAAPQRRLPG